MRNAHQPINRTPLRAALRTDPHRHRITFIPSQLTSSPGGCRQSHLPLCRSSVLGFRKYLRQNSHLPKSCHGTALPTISPVAARELIIHIPSSHPLVTTTLNLHVEPHNYLHQHRQASNPWQHAPRHVTLLAATRVALDASTMTVATILFASPLTSLYCHPLYIALS